MIITRLARAPRARLHYIRPLPRCWKRHPKAHGLIHEADLRVTQHGRLRAKLLVFSSQTAMQAFWSGLNKPVGRGAAGAVNAMGYTVMRVPEKGPPQPLKLCVDPRYFCVISLTQRKLGTEIICHEAVHAAYCFEKRRRRDLWPNALDLDEENVAYPAGILARAMVISLRKARLIPE